MMGISRPVICLRIWPVMFEDGVQRGSWAFFLRNPSNLLRNSIVNSLRPSFILISSAFGEYGLWLGGVWLGGVWLGGVVASSRTTNKHAPPHIYMDSHPTITFKPGILVARPMATV